MYAGLAISWLKEALILMCLKDCSSHGGFVLLLNYNLLHKEKKKQIYALTKNLGLD